MGNQPSTNNNNSGVTTVGRNRNNHNHAVPQVTTTNSTASSSSSSGVQQPAAVTVMKSMFQQLNRESKNALGLTKAELDERCKPSGLYSSCNWDEKAIRRLIGDGKLASRQQCTDEMQIQQQEQHECPICFFNYRQMNTTKCCQANICTECYLQLQPYQKPSPNQNQTLKVVMNVKSQQNACPFCNTAKLQISVAPIKTSRPSEQQPEQPQVTPTKTASTDHMSQPQPESSPNATTPKTGFGSSLEQNSHVAMMRARSCSIASEHSQSSSTPSIKEQQEMVSTVAATAEERHQLEEEMRAQHLHPLALKIQQEENERRLKNELQYYSQRNAMLQRQQQQRQESAGAVATTSSGTLPTQQHLQQPGRFLLSPQFQQQLFPHHHQLHRSGPIIQTAVRGLSEEQQIALAIEASLRETTISGSNTTTTTTTP